MKYTKWLTAKSTATDENFEKILSLKLYPILTITGKRSKRTLKKDRRIWRSIVDNYSLKQFKADRHGRILDSRYDSIKFERAQVQRYFESETMEEQYLLLSLLRNQHRLCDMMIKVLGAEYGCHRTVIFNSCRNVKKKCSFLQDEPVVIIKLSESSHLGLLDSFKFMYKEPLEIRSINVGQLYVTSRELGISRLYYACMQYFAKNLASCPFTLLRIAKKFKIFGLVHSVRQTIFKRKLDVFKCAEMLALDYDELLVIMNITADFRDESKVLDFLHQYIELHELRGTSMERVLLRKVRREMVSDVSKKKEQIVMYSKIFQE